MFETERLVVRTAEEGDAGLYYRLWTDPRVMRFVGFPQGLRVTREEIRERIGRQPVSVYENLLVVERKDTGAAIGEAHLHRPDEAGVAGTDVKLLPEAWGHRFGAEVKAGLVRHQFEHTDCRVVQGTPNRENVASIRMQEAVGAVRVGEGCFEFPEEMRAWTCPVPHFVYHVRREDWERARPDPGDP